MNHDEVSALVEEPFDSVTHDVNVAIEYSDQDDAEPIVDELEALHTTLWYLCLANADSFEIERFLCLHPETLLVENTRIEPDENARFVVEEKLRNCVCTGECNRNLHRIIALLDKNIDYYENKRTHRTALDAELWADFFDKVVKLEREVRLLRHQELSMRMIVLDATVDVRAYRIELDALDVSSSMINQLLCNTRRQKSELDRRRPFLECQAGVLACNLQSVEREHADLLQRIEMCRQAQLFLAKTAFDGCNFHVYCGSSKESSRGIQDPTAKQVCVII